METNFASALFFVNKNHFFPRLSGTARSTTDKSSKNRTIAAYELLWHHQWYAQSNGVQIQATRRVWTLGFFPRNCIPIPAEQPSPHHIYKDNTLIFLGIDLDLQKVEMFSANKMPHITFHYSFSKYYIHKKISLFPIKASRLCCFCTGLVHLMAFYHALDACYNVCFSGWHGDTLDLQFPDLRVPKKPSLLSGSSLNPRIGLHHIDSYHM